MKPAKLGSFDGYHVIENQQYFSDESVIQKMDLALVKTDSDGYPMIPKSNINLPGDWLIIPIGTLGLKYQKIPFHSRDILNTVFKNLTNGVCYNLAVSNF